MEKRVWAKYEVFFLTKKNVKKSRDATLRRLYLYDVDKVC